MSSIKDKIAIITGAASGLGKATAERFAKEGASLILTDINVSAGEELASHLAAAHSDVVFIKHDVTKEDDWRGVFALLTERHQKLDILVNNAGGGTYSDIETLSLEQWRSIIELNLDSVFVGTQMAIASMKETGGGSIINVSSVGGLVGSSNLVAYSSAKAGVKLLTKCSAIHCGQHGYNIRINSIHPGLIRTPAGIEMATRATGLTPAEAETAFSQLHPLGRIGEPAEIANGILYLASEESSFMTGSELVIDGGFTAQ
tara:strand:+ start:76847 stop:77623 length:777 start_codon:yes stop_codon:yes gene_type:complete